MVLGANGFSGAVGSSGVLGVECATRLGAAEPVQAAQGLWGRQLQWMCQGGGVGAPAGALAQVSVNPLVLQT